MMLSAQHVRNIAAGGLGNPRSRLAHACSMFEGRLYLGVTHGKGEGPQDCARILRFSFQSEDWDEVYRSPLVEPDERATAVDVLHPNLRYEIDPAGVPRERGFRAMTVFQGRSDTKPVLYVSTISNWGSLVLRSEDGRQFEVVSEPGLGDDRLLSLRALVPFKGKLFTTPIGGVEDNVLDRNATLRPVVFVSEDPACGVWHEASSEGMGDARNGVLFQIGVLNDHLYVGTGNAERGCELWKTDAQGSPPYRWTKVIERGAARYSLNESIVSLVPFNGALYVGTGLPGLGYDKANDVGPAAAELIRVFPDDTWQLVVGEPRFSRAGLQIPLSAMGPGFSDHRNSVFWRMAVFDGWLIVGTHHWGVYDYVMFKDPVPQGGFQLWMTQNGEAWQPLTLDGFGNLYAVGVRTLLPTPYGVVLGTDDQGPLKQRARRLRGVVDDDPGAPAGFQMWLIEHRDRDRVPVVGAYG